MSSSPRLGVGCLAWDWSSLYRASIFMVMASIRAIILHRLEIHFHVEKKHGFLQGAGQIELGERIDSEEFMNVFIRIGFGSTIKLVSFDKGQVVTFNGKFVSGFRNNDCEIESQSDNTVGSPHEFIIHWIVISKNIKEVTEVIDVENWQIENSRVLRWIVSLILLNSSASLMKSSIQSTFRSCNCSTSSELEARICIQRRNSLGQFARKLYGEF
uniref:Uncharacterized protein n=1 Tax=Tanacetum cinerariifolium TaxID=118510 RepID=A0A699H8D4_TANCI|nr:hypothetical protein [Tanacetum cinerariifolium]